MLRSNISSGHVSVTYNQIWVAHIGQPHQVLVRIPSDSSFFEGRIALLPGPSNLQRYIDHLLLVQYK